jgi:hypothetical protein
MNGVFIRIEKIFKKRKILSQILKMPFDDGGSIEVLPLQTKECLELLEGGIVKEGA